LRFNVFEYRLAVLVRASNGLLVANPKGLWKCTVDGDILLYGNVVVFPNCTLLFFQIEIFCLGGRGVLLVSGSTSCRKRCCLWFVTNMIWTRKSTATK
jgi:hypothetical protein